VQRLAAPSGLALLDDKGNTIPCLSSSALRTALNADGTVVRTYTLSFTPAKDQGPPTKLVMSGSKSITVDIPFTLKDVPLP
jgi:hypothetical protein